MAVIELALSLISWSVLERVSLHAPVFKPCIELVSLHFCAALSKACVPLWT